MRNTKTRLVVVGVHTPEFPFERSASNVQRAETACITYPVAQDNDSRPGTPIATSIAGQ